MAKILTLTSKSDNRNNKQRFTFKILIQFIKYTQKHVVSQNIWLTKNREI